MNLKGSLPLLILHILSQHTSHGYEISKIIRERSHDVLDFREGTLYPTLHSMETNGLLKSYEEKYEGRKRRYYQLTDEGIERLNYERKQWKDYAKSVNHVLAYSADSSPGTTSNDKNDNG